MLHRSKPLLAAHEPCIDKLRPYNIYNHLGGGGVPRYVWNGGGWWGFGGVGGGVVFHCLGFRLVGGIVVGFPNGILMEVLMSSVGVPFGSSAGPSGVRMVGWDSLCSIGTPQVSRCFCMWCGFSLFSNDLLEILIKSLHRVLARHVGRSNVSLR